MRCAPASRPIWEETDELVLSVHRERGAVGGRDRAGGARAKAATACRGCSTRTACASCASCAGFEDEELGKLLDIIQRVRKASPDEDDLLTLLWEGDFALPALPLRRPARDGGDGATLDDGAPRCDRDAPTADDPRALRRRRAEESTRAPASSTWPTSTRRSTSSTRRRSSTSRREVRARVRAATCARTSSRVLLDIFEQQPDADGPRRGCRASSTASCCTCCRPASSTTSPTCCASRGVALAARRGARRAAARAAGAAPDAPERARARCRSCCSRSTKRRRCRRRTELDASCSSSCAAAALATVFEWLGAVAEREAASAARGGGGRAGGAEHGGAGEADRVGRARRGARGDAARRRAEDAGRGRAARARCSTSGDAELRLAAVQALGGDRVAGRAAGARARLDDAERDVRVATRARDSAARRYRAGAAAARGRGEGQGDARRRPDARRWPFFEAYGALCGDGGVRALDGDAERQGVVRPARGPRAPRLRRDGARAHRDAGRAGGAAQGGRTRRTSSCATR